MNAPFPRRALGALAFALVLASPSLARGQDRDYPMPDPVDKRLDEVLRREYGDPNGPPRGDEPPPPPPPAARPHPRSDNAGDVWEDDFSKLRLGMSLDGGLSALLSSRIRGVHSDNYDSDDGHHHHPDGGAFSLHGSTWLDIGRYISVEMASSTSLGRVRHRDANEEATPVNDPTTSSYGGGPNGFSGNNGNGNNGSSSGHHTDNVEFGTIDASLIIHPVNGQYGRLDLIVGGRYLEAREGPRRHQQSIEAGMPMIGIGGMVRPVRTDGGGFALELFARGDVGAMAFGEPQDRYGNHDWYDNNQIRQKYYAVSADAQGGIRFVFMDMFGVALGARFEYADVEKRDSSGTDKKLNWKSVGPFIAFSIEM